MEKDLEEAKRVCENLINVLGTGMVKFGEKIKLGTEEDGYIEAIKKILQGLKDKDEKIKKILED